MHSVSSSAWLPGRVREVAGLDSAWAAAKDVGTADSFGIDVAVVRCTGTRHAWEQARAAAVHQCLAARARTCLALWSASCGRDVSPLLCEQAEAAQGLDPDSFPSL